MALGMLAIVGTIKAPQHSDIPGKAQITPEAAQTSIYEPIIPTRNELKLALKRVSLQYGLDYERFYVTVNGESGFSNDPKHNNQSRGAGQYILSTWLANCSKVDDRTDGQKSIDCMGRMWSKGRMGEWDVYCNFWADPVCDQRGLKPGFLKNFPTLQELLPPTLTK